ncbi:MAG: glycosyltransferase, partial [Anaerolineales bacterium]
MRVLISAGGTGGGVYPALSVASALRMADGGWRIENQNSEIPNPKSELLWIGSVGGMEAEIVSRAGLPFKAIRGAGVHGIGWRLPLNALNLLWGVFEAVRLVRAFQ